MEERRHRRGKMEETMLVELTRIVLGKKMKKIHVVDPVTTNGREDLKQQCVNLFF
jgi:hypothetical protein